MGIDRITKTLLRIALLLIIVSASLMIRSELHKEKIFDKIDILLEEGESLLRDSPAASEKLPSSDLYISLDDWYDPNATLYLRLDNGTFLEVGR